MADNNCSPPEKRRKLNNNTVEARPAAAATHSRATKTNTTSSTANNNIMHLPPELLQMIFKHIPCADLSGKVRLVNRKFRAVAEAILNASFKDLSGKLETLVHRTNEAINITTDDFEIRCLCKLLNLLEWLTFHHSIIMATIWRYTTYNKFYETKKSCMFAGRIIDIYNIFLDKFDNNPEQLYSPSIIKDFTLPPEAQDIIYMSKYFCVHFDKVVEETLRSNKYNSGCKIIDLLNCGNFCRRLTASENVSNNQFHGKYSYHLDNAWFIVFNIPLEAIASSTVKQRLMHLRVRRIVVAHTDSFMPEFQYARECIFRQNATIQCRLPSAYVYTGYGEASDQMFYYGAMNDSSYFQKFHSFDFNGADNDDDDDENEQRFAFNLDQDHANNDANDDDDDDDNNEEFEDATDEEIIPHLGVDIDVTVECPLTHAPNCFLKNKWTQPKEDTTTQTEFDKFSIDVKFQCPGAIYPQLPTTYRYIRSWN